MRIAFSDQDIPPAMAIILTCVAVGCAFVAGQVPLIVTLSLMGGAWGDLARFLLIIAGAVLLSLVAHSLVRRWFFASLVAAFVFAIAVNLYLPPWTLFQLVSAATVGYGVATAIGLIFYFRRRSAGIMKT